MRKLSVLVVLVALMFVGFALTGAVHGADTGGSGSDRWVSFELDDDTAGQEYETAINMTVPTVVYEIYTFTGTFEHVRPTGNETLSVVTNVSVTFANETETFGPYFATEITVTSNATADVSVPTELTAGMYWVTYINVTDTGGAIADSFSPTAETFNVTVLTSLQYTMQVTTVNLIISLIPIIVLFVVVLPVIFKLLKGIGEEAEK